MPLNIILFISMSEIVVIVFIAFLLFGTEKLPEILRGLGKGYREFQKATDEIKSELNKVTDDIKDEAKKVKNDIDDSTKDTSNKAG
jgi:sec-independent protein translocase protein TatA